MEFTHVCNFENWKRKGQPAEGPKIDEKVKVLYECANINGTVGYRLKNYPGCCFDKTHFTKIKTD